MVRTILIAIAAAAALLPARLPAQQEEPVKPEGGAGQAERTADDIRAEIQRLREEHRRLAERIRELERETAAPTAEERKAPARRLREAWHTLVQPRDFHIDVQRFMDRARDLREHAGEFRELFGQGRSVIVRQGQDGGIRVEVRTRGEDGEETSEVFEAANAAEFREKHADAMKRYGISFGEDGGVRVETGPPWRLWKYQDELPAPEFHAPEIVVPHVEPLVPPAADPDRLGVWVGRAEGEDGLPVTSVEEKSLAARMGLQEGDVLVAIDGKKITGVGTIRDALRKAEAGAEVTVEVRRGEETLKLSATKADRRKARKIV